MSSMWNILMAFKEFLQICQLQIILHQIQGFSISQKQDLMCIEEVIPTMKVQGMAILNTVLCHLDSPMLMSFFNT